MNNVYVNRLIVFLLLFTMVFNYTYLQAAISQAEFDEEVNSYIGILKKTEEIREATFWEKHKWKIITGALVIGGGITIFCTGGAAAPAVGHGAACIAAMGGAAMGGASLLSPGALFIGGAGAVLVGSCFSEDEPKKDGAKTFINGSVAKYMKEHNIKLTDYQKQQMQKAIDKNKGNFAKTSSTKEEFLKKIDACALSALKNCL